MRMLAAIGLIVVMVMVPAAARAQAATTSARAQGTTRLPNIGTPPAPMQVITPLVDGAPASLKGKSVRVVFTVDTVGHVSSVVTIPTITDSVYAKRFAETMRGYRFRPAKDSTGRPVSGEHRTDITFKQ